MVWASPSYSFASQAFDNDDDINNRISIIFFLRISSSASQLNDCCGVCVCSAFCLYIRKSTTFSWARSSDPSAMRWGDSKNWKYAFFHFPFRLHLLFYEKLNTHIFPAGSGLWCGSICGPSPNTLAAVWLWTECHDTAFVDELKCHTKTNSFSPLSRRICSKTRLISQATFNTRNTATWSGERYVALLTRARLRDIFD